MGALKHHAGPCPQGHENVQQHEPETKAAASSAALEASLIATTGTILKLLIKSIIMAS